MDVMGFWATLAASAAAVVSAIVGLKALKIAAAARYDTVRPVLDLRKSQEPTGRWMGAEGQSAARYTFTMTNVGTGVAVLGITSFESPSAHQVLRAELNRKPLGGKFAVIDPETTLPNTLRPNEEILIKVGTGHLDREVMGDTFRLPKFRYTDVLKRPYVMEVDVDTHTGDVVAISVTMP